MSWSHVAVFVLFLLAGSGGRAEAADARHGQRSAEARASRAARAAASLETMREEFVRPEMRAMVAVEETPDALIAAFERYQAPKTPKWIKRSET